MVGGKGGYFNGNCLGCGKYGHRVADCRSRPGAYEVSYEEPEGNEASSVDVDWMVFGVDVEVEKGVWEDIGKKRGNRFKLGAKQSSAKVVNHFVNKNSYETLEFEDSEQNYEMKTNMSCEGNQKTEMTVNNFMKIKQSKPMKKKVKPSISQEVHDKGYENALKVLEASRSSPETVCPENDDGEGCVFADGNLKMWKVLPEVIRSS